MLSAHELNVKGAEFFNRGDLDGARWHYLAALSADPEFFPALCNVASVLAERGHDVASIAATRRVLARDPQSWQAWNNLGTRLMLTHNYVDAEAAMRKAMELAPQAGECYHNLALLCHRQGRQVEALEFIDRVMQLGNRRPQVLNDYTHMLLKAHSSLQEALAAYESRWYMLKHLLPWDFHIAEWQGQELKGQRLLLHAEQGYGDTLMCLRFVRPLEALGASVTLAVHKPLLALCAHNGFHAIDIDTLDVAQAQHFTFHSPMYGAMRWLGTEWNNIVGTPYLKAPTQAVAAIDSRLTNVGICWASGHRDDALAYLRRVTPLSDWLVLAEDPRVQLWSLQKGHDEGEIERCGADALLRDVTPALNNWLDTARLIASLDAVVTVDTAVAHLAAAMGKPTIMVSQHAACWRWRDIALGSGAPWYDSMQIIHQRDPHDWRTPLREANVALHSLLAHRQISLAA